MNLEEKNIIEPKDEILLEKMSSYFKREREKSIIHAMVSKKIAETDFNSLTLKRNGHTGYRKFGFAVFTVLLLSTILYFVYNDNFQESNPSNIKSDNDNSQYLNKSKLNSGQNNTNLNSNRISENEPSSKMTANEKRNKEKITAIKGFENKYKRNEIVASENQIERSTQYQGQRISSSINLSNDFQTDDLRKELSAMLVKFGFNLEKNTGNEHTLEIKTKNIYTLSKNGYPVEYNVNFIIEKNNPTLLKIYMEYFEEEKNKNIDATGSTMEDMFYNKIANGIIDIIKN